MNKQLLLCFIWRLRPHVNVRQPNASANASALPLAAISHRPPPPSPARYSRPPSPPSSRCRLLPLLALAPVAVKLSRPAGGQERVRAAVRGARPGSVTAPMHNHEETVEGRTARTSLSVT